MTEAKPRRQYLDGDVGVRYDPQNPQYGRDINLVRFNGAKGFLTLWVTREELEKLADAVEELLDYLDS